MMNKKFNNEISNQRWINQEWSKEKIRINENNPLVGKGNTIRLRL
jgi:hypothetical protein